MFVSEALGTREAGMTHVGDDEGDEIQWQGEAQGAVLLPYRLHTTIEHVAHHAWVSHDDGGIGWPLLLKQIMK